MFKTEILAPLAIQEMEIIKEAGPDNEIVYRHPAGSVVYTYSLGFYDLMHGWLRKIQSFIDLLSPEDHGDIIFIAVVLLRDMENQLGEIDYLIEKHIGKIDFDIVARGNVVYREDRLLSASLTKNKKVRNKKEAPAVDDQAEAPNPDQDRSENTKETLHIEK